MVKKISAEDQAFEELVKIIEKDRKDLNLVRIKKAYKFAKDAHKNQFRMSGEPYVCHPVETAKILVNLLASEDVVIAGILHDVPEDTFYTLADVEKRFGKHIAKVVGALTKLSKVYYRHSMGERQIRSLRKMFLETANDVDVVIVKLADRLHNMQTLQYLRPDKQQRIAKETMEIYAPLANLYGVYQLRRKLEDLCFMYLQPEESSRIEAFVHDHEKKRKHFIHDTIKVLSKVLKKNGIKSELSGRPKHFYSIYQKSVRDQKILQDIFDYSAIRIIVKNKEECYHALGLVHETFRPKPKRVKDYIAFPKPNGYQSLHTTVIGLRGKLTEIQIRTEEMHRDAEYGAAAHAFYKDEGTTYLNESIEKLKKYKNPESFIKGLQDDVLQERIFVFSPKGEIVNLPAGATCLDYIFEVGVAVNKKNFRAVVNQKTYSLIGELQSGDHVEILFGNRDQNGPERWWLEHVKTATAKERIQEHFKKKSLQTKVGIGERLLQQELDHENQGLIYQLPKSRIEKAVRRFKAKNFERVLSDVGEGILSSNEVYKSMFPALNISIGSRFFHAFSVLFQKFNLRGLEDEENKFRIRVLVEAYDWPGGLIETVAPFNALKIPILKNKGGVYFTKKKMPLAQNKPAVPINPRRISSSVFEVLVDDQEELIALFDRLEKVPGVLKVQRLFRRRQIGFAISLFATITYVVGHPFLIQYLQRFELAWGEFISSLIIYIGLSNVFFLMAWLRNMSSRTFPHFGETRLFWSLSFGLAILAIVVIFVDDVVLDLNLQLPIMIGLSLSILIFLFFNYRLHERRKKRHLSRLKSSRPQMGE
jgi:GTP diphosphokinase / guanosine-3',5'-bis(diphosphate) 3'-diphosphatase